MTHKVHTNKPTAPGPVKRVILFVLDSVGIGALPDAGEFGDTGANTLKSLLASGPEVKLPNLIKLGLGHIEGVDYVPRTQAPAAAFGRMSELSNGKDTTTGHWEIAGLKISEPFQTFPDGFPPHIINAFEAQTGRKALCNKPASGTEVIETFGKEHMETGNPIVYTSADSVFQIAAHEEVVGLEELYRMCEIAREILRGKDQVARVIARPFVGKPGAFTRTSNRRDYSLKPFAPTVLDKAMDAGYDVQAVGKIHDIFNGQGITEEVHTKDNMDGIDKTLDYLKTDSTGIIFTNLVDFDAKFGHRRDAEGYRLALEAFDQRLPELLDAMKPEDLLILLADHGNDPGFKGSDHTREYVPLLVTGHYVKEGTALGTRETFADIAQTTAEILGLEAMSLGRSLAKEILK
ncbi:phosphopentomutase [Acidaminobacter hydrogenoformans]|uniref:Phosphopentomutase n=1 Tax=Acidaminobacter hydrogenoformans DSM 2784 TaxID=1120920 RepID=A0A1G5S8T5_9FIRM|nr:phosphopentomutase [Acidaminobacter hydrogenoformans]SCZ82029.1 phosphopentomutase [Acidaminobacter hydrogenoformans DSM 2784]